MTDQTGTRVKGHALVAEGAPFTDDGKRSPRWHGRAKCECGVLSEPMPSAYQRRKWHREVHKPSVVSR